MSVHGKLSLSVVLALLLAILAVDELEAKCRSSKKSKEMASMGCCNMKDMDMGGSQEGKTAQGSHGDMHMEGEDCCEMMDMKGDTQNMPDMETSREKPPAAGKIIQSQRVEDLAIAITNQPGQLTRGPNSFCVEFRKVDTGQMTDVGDVQVDFTMRDMAGMRTLAQVIRSSVGRYCGRVTLTMAGEWSAAVNYDGPSGKGKARFKVTAR